MSEFEIAIVGGGPAGLSAALEASRAGARVALIDEYHQLGGQYFKQPRPGLHQIGRGQADRQAAEGARLIAAVQAANVEVFTDTLVWTMFDERTLATYHPTRDVDTISAQQVILAPGAHERVIALPGWTLPGVMTGGAALALLTEQGVLPGRRVALFGTGPLQLRVASLLVEAGAEVVAVVEANEGLVSIRGALRVLGDWGRTREATNLWRTLRQGHVRLLDHRLPVRIEGENAVEAVWMAAVDEAWNVHPGTAERLTVDCVLLTYGLLPSIELARLAGCEVLWDSAAAAWLPVRDDCFQSSVPGIYIVGNGASLGGADAAFEEGAIAGLAAAVAIGRAETRWAESQIAARRKRLAKAQKFAAQIFSASSIKPAVVDLMTDDTVICRCEDVLAGNIRQAVRMGGPSLRSVKALTRAGFGPCQGRTCGPLVARIIAAEAGLPFVESEPDTPRPPVKPVPLQAISGLGAHEAQPTVRRADRVLTLGPVMDNPAERA